MSYWTYSDLFEEAGPPPSSFTADSGFLNREGIRKPAFFAYKYLHALQGNNIATSDPQALVAAKNGNLTVLMWDFQQPQQKLSNRSFYTKVVPDPQVAATVKLQVTHLASRASYQLKVYRTGYRANDAYSAYLEMGSPKDLSAAQVAHLNYLTRDAPERDDVVRSAPDGTAVITVPMSSNDIVLLELVIS